MSRTTGFFTRTEITKSAQRRAPRVAAGARGLGSLSLDVLRKQGPDAVRNMNPAAKHHNMAPTVARAQTAVLFLGEAPGAQEDEKGAPFVGPAGATLRDAVDQVASEYNDVRRYVSFDNVCRTRPPSNREPTDVELEAYRATVEQSIAKLKPAVVVPLGAVPWSWFYKSTEGKRLNITDVRGLVCRTAFAGHAFYVCPTYHPSFVMRAMGSKERTQGLSGEELHSVFVRDLQAAFDLVDAKPPKVLPGSALRTGVVHAKSATQFVELVRELDSSRWPLAFDLETTAYRPYGNDARVLSCSVSDGVRTVTLARDHSETNHSKAERQKRRDAMRWVFCELKPQNGFVAQGLTFDMEWLLWDLQDDSVLDNEWHCTIEAEYVCDERSLSTKALDFLGYKHYGIRVKKEFDEGRDRTNLDRKALSRVLEYNAGDSKITNLVARKALPRALEESPEGYARQMRRVPSAVCMQRKGLPCNEAVRVELLNEFGGARDSALKQLLALDSTKAWQADHRADKFNPNSTAHLSSLFVEYERLTGLVDKQTKKVSTAEEALVPFEDNEAVALVQRFRKARKITSTYLRRFDPRAADTYVYPDGLIHCRYKTAFTKTSRFACEDPNNQNWPKRDPVAKRVRRMVQMRGHSIVACDLGQGEARVIAMHSRDKTLCRALRTNYDIHLEWAEKVASAWPKALSAVDNDMKRLRTGIKNQLVFPAFYGASVKRIAKELHLPESVAEELFEEFWQQFKGVRAWQRTLLQEYKEYGYVTSLTGRRRHGPMGYNDIINSPIQAACSDILIDGIDALVRRSIEEDKPYLMPALNIHDDATTWTPNKYVDEVLAIMVEEMLRKRYDWQCVPLTVELECGPDWYNMKPIGTFRSDEL